MLYRFRKKQEKSCETSSSTGRNLYRCEYCHRLGLKAYLLVVLPRKQLFTISKSQQSLFVLKNVANLIFLSDLHGRKNLFSTKPFEHEKTTLYFLLYLPYQDAGRE